MTYVKKFSIKVFLTLIILLGALFLLAQPVLARQEVQGVEYSDAGRLTDIDYYNENFFTQEELNLRGLIAEYSDSFETLTLINIAGTSSIDLTLNENRNGAFGTYIFDEEASVADLPPGLRECFGGNFNDYLTLPDTNNIQARQPAFGDTNLNNTEILPGGRYLLFECLGGINGGSGPSGDLYVTTRNGASLDPDDNGSVGNPSNDWTWVDYSGSAYDASPGNGTFPAADRFRFLSPFEIIDRNEEYPGTDKNVIYAAIRGDAFGDDGSLRLLEDGIIFYWPLREEAVLDGRYVQSDYDWQLPNDGVCRSGFAVRTRSNTDGEGNYGKIRKVLTRTISSSSNDFGHDCVAVHPTSANDDGDIEFNQVRVVPNSMYGFFGEQALRDRPNLDFSDQCSGACPSTLLTDRFYNNTFNARFFYAQFYWDIEGVGTEAQSVIRPYNTNNEGVSLRPYTGDPADSTFYDRLINNLITEEPNHPDLGRLDSLSLQANNTVIYTTDACIADNLRSFLLLSRNPDAEGLDDSTMTAATIPHTQALIYTSDSSGNYTTGWNDGAVSCLGVYKVESNAAEILFDWVEGASAGDYRPNIDDQPTGGDAHTAFIAYPSRSTLGDNDPQSGRTGAEEVVVDGSAQVQVKPTCETRLNNPLTWLACPLLNIADEVIIQLDLQLSNLLEISSEDLNRVAKEGGTYKDSWSILKNLATIGVVFTALFMVISTALDVGFFSNYTVKKYLPRLVISVIGIQLSWVLGTLLIEIVNQIGSGVEAIIYYPFPGALDFSFASLFPIEDEFTDTNGLLFSGAVGIAVVGLAGLGLFGILAIAYTVAGALLAAFFALIFRKLAIIILLILFPLAIAAWVLPGDDGLWKKWRTTFVSLLFMYPVLIIVIAAGKVMAYLTSGADVNDNGDVVSSNLDDLATWIISIVAYVAGYVAVPIIFRSFSGVFSNLTGMVNNKSKGLFDRGRNNLSGLSTKRKDYKKGIKKERRAERAADGGISGAAARAGMRTEAGMRITGRRPINKRLPGAGRAEKHKYLDAEYTRTQQAMDKAQGEVFKQQAEDAKGSMSTERAKSDPTKYLMQSKGDLKTLAMDASEGRARRQAAYDRLVEMKSDQEMREIDDLVNSGSADSTLKGMHTSAKSSGSYAGAFAEKAPDLVKGGRDNVFADGAGAKPPSVESQRGWSVDTYLEALQHATTNGHGGTMAAQIKNNLESDHVAAAKLDGEAKEKIENAIHNANIGLADRGNVGGPRAAVTYAKAPKA